MKKYRIVCPIVIILIYIWFILIKCIMRKIEVEMITGKTSELTMPSS